MIGEFVVGRLLARASVRWNSTRRFASRYSQTLLAQLLVEPFGLVSAPHPAELPEVAITLFWHAKLHRSAANQWLREQIVDLFADRTDSVNADLR